MAQRGFVGQASLPQDEMSLREARPYPSNRLDPILTTDMNIKQKNIEQNLRQVEARIAEAALRSGRDPAEITLVAVTKTHPPAAVVAAYRAGARHFGENRVEEGGEKIPIVRTALEDKELKGSDAQPPVWHMIGHIQSRKAQAVVADFDVVHSVDRLKIARRLSHFVSLRADNRPLPILLECNVSGEASKFGFDMAGWEQDASRRTAFFSAVDEISHLPGLSLEGLMTMAPQTDDPETVRPVFASLRALQEALRERFPALPWSHLSMGMTDDFEVAIEEGATIVRIGRAIFGPRGK